MCSQRNGEVRHLLCAPLFISICVKLPTFQLEQGVVHFALHLPGALHDARHPEALVDGLGGHNVVPRIGADFPLGHGSADHYANPANEGQDEAQHLQTTTSHLVPGPTLNLLLVDCKEGASWGGGWGATLEPSRSD